MFVLKLLARLFKILRSGASPAQIAGGFCLGMIVGLTPIASAHNLIILALLIVLKVNLSMAILSVLIFSAVAYLFDPLFHAFGYWLLVDAAPLRGLWFFLTDQPLLALANLNNTVVLGSLAAALILFAPAFWLVVKGVRFYRATLGERMEKWKVVQAVKSSRLFSLYEKFKLWGE